MTRLFKLISVLGMLTLATAALLISPVGAGANQDGPLSPDHYWVYDVKPQDPLALPALLRDQFGVGAYTVLDPVALYNPAEKTVKGQTFAVNHPQTHLVAYRVELIEGDLSIPKGVRVFNQFHPRSPLRVSLRDPDLLLVPSSKALAPQEPLPPLDELGVHSAFHFKCYPVGIKGHLRGRKVGLRDQFQGADRLVLKPTRLCTPVVKTVDEQTVGGNVAPPDHLMCYIFRNPTETPIAVNVANQFTRPVLSLDVTKERELCVPSEKVLPQQET